ncbi:hypothetical protein IMZ11_26100 [Microtetraspora sp. AC03309]|uniref:hypothetical protein n=1 Tax=Microtetraspora sp. AC03309 TaxID=2779376 RepID=UPI001E32145B|nr:hypothetical protein [Microtetraspora sp. AC03309]MCC5579103.1 hypothetical protein [Microtetraspora sp. AC03309]
MRRFLTAATCLTAALLMSPVMSPVPAHASAGSSTVERRTTKVRVTYPSAIRRGRPARFTFTVTRPDQIDDEALVLETDLPHGIVSKVRFVTKPRGAKCGAQKRNSAGNYGVYCVVRSLDYTKITMSFNVWLKSSYYGKFRASHYWAPVTLDYGGSIGDYLDEITRDDLIGRGWVKVR